MTIKRHNFHLSQLLQLLFPECRCRETAFYNDRSPTTTSGESIGAPRGKVYVSPPMCCHKEVSSSGVCAEDLPSAKTMVTHTSGRFPTTFFGNDTYYVTPEGCYPGSPILRAHVCSQTKRKPEDAGTLRAANPSGMTQVVMHLPKEVMLNLFQHLSVSASRRFSILPYRSTL